MARWRTVRLFLFLVLSLLLPSGRDLRAQGSRADYERADKLRELTQNKVFRAEVAPNWLPGNTRFWYRVKTGPATHEFVMVDVVAGKRAPAFDHARLSEALREAGVKEAAPDRLPLTALEFEEGGAIKFRAGEKGWRCDLASYELTAAPVQAVSAAEPMSALPRASRRTGPETFVTFVNRSGGEVQLWWLSTEGERRGYGRIRNGVEHRQHTYAGHVWIVTDAGGKDLTWHEAREAETSIEIDGRVVERPEPASATARSARRPGVSPDGRWTAFIKGHNVWLRDETTKEEAALSVDGTEDDYYAPRFYWSPDSSRLAVIRTTRVETRQIHLIESSPKDQLQPKLHSFDYAKPGDPLSRPRPVLFEVAGRRSIPLSDELFLNPYALTEFRWSPDSTRFTFHYNQRGHQVYRVIELNAATAQSRAVVGEECATFFDYAHKRFIHWLDSTGEIIWMSERDGWNHLYLYDGASGRVKNQITRGEWLVRKVERVDEAARQVWFLAGGVRPGEDPYHLHLCRVNFDGTGFVVLTEGDGSHAVQWSPDRRHFVDTWSRANQPPVNELRRAADGSLVCELERADWIALLAAGWRAPERFTAKGRDGVTDIHGVIYKPTNFDPARKYPVIEDIYAGPHGAFTPKTFNSYYKSQSMAELGFIVVKLDGMGTNWRSKRFHDVAWKNLSDSGFPDRIAWIKAAASTRPWMDLERVGIFGGSAGGQSTVAGLLHHGDFYKAGVADCGCHDNRMDKIWWNELWMGWPVEEHYARNSNASHAGKLRGKLMLVVGELDRNVDPASTMQLVHALQKADKDFDLLVMAGTGHGAAETPYASRRRMDFFVRHLLGREPRWTE